MSEFDIYTLDKLIKQFNKVTKRVLQNRPISKRECKINEYIQDLTSNYDIILEYFTKYEVQLKQTTKNIVNLKIEKCKKDLIKCFEKLNYKYPIKSEINPIHCINKNSKIVINYSENTLNLQNSTNMATSEEKRNFVSLCSSILRDNYNGNPLALESFLDKISLIEEFTEDNLKNVFISFVKSKLEGKAREALPENISSINEIKSVLKNRIRPENSKVVAGKIAALQVRNNNYSDFSKQAEELAEALERSLIIEGISKNKAQEMAIEQTVTVCRLNAKTDLVKAILASSTFTDPKEVVAKLIVEQNNETQEKKVFAMHSSQSSYQNRNNYRKNRGNYSNRGNSNQNYRYSNQNNRNFNNTRGYYRSNRGRNFNNNKGTARGGAYVHSLNSENPQHQAQQQQMLLGERDTNQQ